MCTPVAIPIAIAAAGMAAKGYESYRSGQASQWQANRQAGTMRFNAGIADQAAMETTWQTQEQAGRLRLGAGSRLAHGVAATAESNVALAGSPVHALADTAWLSAQDLATLRSGGARKALADLTEGGNLRTGAESLSRAAVEASRQSNLTGWLTGGVNAGQQIASYGESQGWLQSQPNPGGTSGFVVGPQMISGPNGPWANEEDWGG